MVLVEYLGNNKPNTRKNVVSWELSSYLSVLLSVQVLLLPLLFSLQC